jgi:hypothetical protein
MVTMFNPFSFTKSHATFSAIVLDKKYHIYNKHFVIMRLLVKMIADIDDVKTTFFVCAFAQEASTFRVPLTAGPITSACHVHKLSMPLEDTNPHDHPPFIFLSILVPIYCFFHNNIC